MNMKNVVMAVAVAAIVGAAGAAFAAGYYTTGATGYDVAQKTSPLPASPFGFGIVNVTNGRAYGHNPELASEFAWAEGGTQSPTLYINLNTDVGSTAKGDTATPEPCLRGKTAAICKAYNYGYNAAQDAYAYAQSERATSSLWWLDIETANSWSPDTAINDATIQGAIDSLNQRGISVGIYSTQGMWDAIGGSAFVPAQAASPLTPNWEPIGAGTEVQAQSSCSTLAPFIQGSPLWLIQYEPPGSKVDNDYSC